MKRKEKIFLVIVFLLVFSLKDYVFSQVATFFKVEDKDIKAGDILSKKGEKLVKSSQPYDRDIFGVVVNKPIVSLGKAEEGAYPVITSGVALVRVNGTYEAIKRGDYITSSDKPGVGRKAPYPGYVLGRALEDFSGEEGLILVYVQPQEANFEEEKSWEKITFWEAVGRIIRALERDVPHFLRYVFAIVIATASFVLGLRAFMANLREGIRGISRNPLARHSIRLAMILNLIGIVVVTLAGLGLALFVILL